MAANSDTLMAESTGLNPAIGRRLDKLAEKIPGLGEPLGRGDLDAARQSLVAATKSGPYQGLAHYGLAILAHARANLGEAIALAERATELLPYDTESWRLLTELMRDNAGKMQRSSLPMVLTLAK